MELEEVVGGLSQVSVERRNMDVALKPKSTILLSLH